MHVIGRGSLPLCLLLGTLTTISLADSPTLPVAYVNAGQGGHYYFKMIPENGKRPARGEAYAVNADGPDRLIWSVSGWYSHATYLSYDGENLVRIGEWSFGGQPTDRNLGIAFYKRDQLLKQYSVKELVEDPSRAPRSVSFSHYLGDVKGFEPSLDRFTLKTCDGIAYTFDVKSGAIVSRTR